MRHKRFRDPIYNAEIHVITDCSHDAMNIKLNKLYKNIEEDKEQCFNKAECFRLIHDNNYKNYVVWFLEFKSNKAEILYTIAHEVSHLVDKIFEDRGVKDTEARAYYIEYWVRELWRFCSKKKNKPKGGKK